MKKAFKEKILEEANSWVMSNQKVVLATVIQTWGSSPFQIGSKMIVNNKGYFLGSVSGGCIEANVISECLKLIKNKILFKKLEFKISNKNAWDVGLACGGQITIFIEQINS